MAKMQIALYKGDLSLKALIKDPGKYVGHVGICIRTLSKYSHAELVIDGKCWSSSARDGGVRGKYIEDLRTSGHWDIFDVVHELDDPDQALTWFLEHEGAPYDWFGIMRFVLPFVPQKKGWYFCSEAIAAALGVASAFKVSPKDLLQFVVRT